jgi:hypothetical protein
LKIHQALKKKLHERPKKEETCATNLQPNKKKTQVALNPKFIRRDFAAQINNLLSSTQDCQQTKKSRELVHHQIAA